MLNPDFKVSIMCSDKKKIEEDYFFYKLIYVICLTLNWVENIFPLLADYTLNFTFNF